MILTCPPAAGRTDRPPSGSLRSAAAARARRRSPLPGGRSRRIRRPFDEITHGAAVPVLVDFWADWCGPCKTAAPEVAKTAAEMKGRAIVLKVDTERWPQLAAAYNVQGIPNFAVLKAGKLVYQQPGAVPSATMTRWLEEAARTS